MINTAHPFVWLNPTGAAHHLGVDRSTLREWRETAGLPHHRAGSAGFLYEAAALEAWLAAHEAVRRPVRLSRYAAAGR
jgi:helix-turn-helix protein